MAWNRMVIITALLVAGLMVAGCVSGESPTAPSTTPTPTLAATPEELRIATTTSLYDTKLLDHLQSIFEKEYNAKLLVVSAGTGKALEYGQRGDVDVMMVHDRAREDTFIADGDGLNRRVIAYNYFVIIGPESDPAGIKGTQPEVAFKTLMEKGKAGEAGVVFVSRGDASGTHAKEKAIWKAAGFDYEKDVQNSGNWYVEAGSGMGATLVMANEKEAYTLSDIGTFLAYKGDLTLVPVVSKGDILLNVYSAMLINPEKHTGVDTELGKKWINFLTSDEAQQEIASFGVVEYGEPLFFPAKGNWAVMGVSEAEVSAPVL
jgi:tungstate transport system substrate-binding protein